MRSAGERVQVGVAIDREHPKVQRWVGMFSGQWAVGLIINQWPQTAAGYAPEAYPWAIGSLWLVQFAGLAWLWSGRKLFR